MEKRVLLAAFLSLLVLLLWSFLFPTPRPKPAATPVTGEVLSAAGTPAPPPIAAATGATAAPAPAPAAAASGAPAPAAITGTPVLAAAEESIVLENGRARVRLSNHGAAIRSWELVGYKSDGGGPLDLVAPGAPTPLALVFPAKEATEWVASALHRATRVSPSEVVFEAADGKGLRSLRSYELRADGTVDYTVETTGGGGAATLTLGPGARPLSREEAKNRFLAVGSAIFRSAGKLERTPAPKLKAPVDLPAGLEFAGLDDAYFVLAVSGGPTTSFRLEPQQVTVGEPKDGKPAEVRDEIRLVVRPGAGPHAGRLIFAPKNLELLREVGYGLEDTLEFGWFGFLAKGFLVALRWIHGWAGNWGIAIILLTIAIRVVLFFVTFKSILTMKKMQLLGPKVEAIKEKHRKKKADPETRAKMNQEMMALYQEEGVNPAAGCLPVVFQIPIFIAFYNLLAHAIELRQAPFALWLNDLSVRDPYYVVPILMGVAWFIQTLITPATGDPVQRKIFLVLPIVFTITMLNFPAGLTLYWLVSNLMSIAQQVIVNRIDPAGSAPAAKAA